MSDPRIEGVTDLLRQMYVLSGKCVELLGHEEVSFEIIRGDLERKRNEMTVLDSQKAVAILEIEKSREIAVKIIETAKEEARKVIEDGKNASIKHVLEVNRILEAAKVFAGDMDKKRYLKLKDEAQKVI